LALLVTENSLKKEYKGKLFKIVHCDDAIDSFNEAIRSVTPHNKQKSFTRQMILMIEKLAKGERLSKENFPPEGNLPANNGKFNAFKRIPIRAYCWRSKKHPNTYYISHYVYKDQQKLDPKDTQKVCRNWRKIEEE
jgi:hypothetical protein